MQNCDDGEEVLGVESSADRTDQTPSLLCNRTWDASYGIVFGSLPPTRQGHPPQPRTFKTSPSSQFRFLSASSTASLSVRPLQRSNLSSTTKPHLETEDDDPCGSLALRPLQNRCQVQIPNPGSAAASLDPSKAPRLEERKGRLHAEAQRLEHQRRQHHIEARKLEDHRINLMAENNVKEIRQKTDASGGSINQIACLVCECRDAATFLQSLADAQEKTEGIAQAAPACREEALKESMGCPKPMSLDADELSIFGESVEESIQGGGISSFDDSVREPTHHDAQLSSKPPGSLSYQRDLEANATYWDYTQYIGPNNGRVRVHYCASRGTTERVIQKYFMDEEVIGFDMEWKANSSSSDSVKDNISLIQVASEQRIGLFHIARYEKDDVPEDLVAPALRTLMESSKVIKTGVNIKADCTRLWKHLGIESKGLFELSHIFKLVKYAQLDPSLIDKRPVKMSDQVEKHLGLPLWKGDVRTSNWAEKLGNEQILYAASDPYACLHLFDVLESKRKAIVPRPPRPEFAELNKPILLANGQSIGAFKKTMDVSEFVESEEVEEIDQDTGLSALDSRIIHQLESTVRDEADKEPRTRSHIRKVLSEHRPTDQPIEESILAEPGLTAITTRPANPKVGTRSRSNKNEPSAIKDPKQTRH